MTDTAQSREHEGLTQAEIDELVSQADTGGRSAGPFIGRLIAGIALVWSLFQLWFASPLPFAFGFGVFNDTEARSIHLAFAVVLAFLAFPPAHTAVQTALGVIVPLVLGGLLALSAGDIFPVWVVLLVTIVVAGACALPTRNDRVAIHEWAMAIAGGFSPRANQGSVDITRDINGEVITGRVRTSDPLLPGDTVYVRERLF